MTIASGTVKAGPYEGNAAATSFAFTFKCFQSSDLLVVHYDGVDTETELTEGVDYSATLNGDQEASPGGSVTYPLSGSPLPATEFITIVSSVEYTQGLDLILGGNWNPDSVEQALDRLTLMAAQNKEGLSRALQVGVGTGISPDAFAADIEAQADAALNSAGAAANSAGAAASSAVLAGGALQVFRDLWVGAHATDPATDGNGNPLTEGDLYWNTVVPGFRVYSGGAWITYLDPGLTTISSFAATLLDDTSAAQARSTLALGTAATANIGTSGATVPLLDAALQTFSGAVLFTDRIVARSGSNAFQHQTPTNADVDVFQVYDSNLNLVGSLRVYSMDGAGGGGLAINSFDAFTVNPPLICTNGGTVVGSFFVQNSPVATYSTYTASTQATLPLGSIVLCYDSGAVGYARHSVVPVKYASANTFFFTTGTGVSLTGTWRSRGYLYTDSPTNTENYVLCQRVA